MSNKLLVYIVSLFFYVVTSNALIIKKISSPLQDNVEIVLEQSESNQNLYTAKAIKTNGEQNQAISYATISYEGNTTGWNKLTTWANPKCDAEETSYFIGLCEGSLGTDLQYQYWHNVQSTFCDNREELCRKISDFINENTKWIKHMIELYKNESSYWYQVNLVYNQLKGIADGYSRFKYSWLQNLTYSDFLMLNMGGDLYDLVDKFEEGLPRKLFDEGHCSALVKLLPKNKDLYVAHNTWTRYKQMTRILKLHGNNFQKSSKTLEVIPGSNISFSSYPGIIHSIDDFYLTSAGLAVQETTIGNSNTDLWKYVTPNGTVLEFVRVLVANRLATSGKEWTKIFSQYNSGTYNNQWMIVDYKKFKRGKTPKKDLLWVLEQIPGNIKAEDQTKFLVKKTYWPSYNIPFYKNIFKLSGQDEMVKKYGEWFSYNNNPRAKIFKRDHKKVKSMETLLTLMRSNNYKDDPYSKCANCTPPYSASNALAARHDLNPANGSYPFPYLGHRPSGAIDAKLTNSSLIKKLSFVAVSGPTTGTNLPVFKWSTSDFTETQLHLGQPDEWNFKPILYKPH